MIKKIVATACLALCAAASAQQDGRHIVVAPNAIKWGPAPAALPPGAKSALLYGDPAKPELFVMRVWLPKGYRIAPHTHARPEVVTVISGGGLLGYGKVADGRNTHRLATGTFMVTPPDTPHYVTFDRDTILQLSTIGPWSLTYVNPGDDPRNKPR